VLCCTPHQPAVSLACRTLRASACLAQHLLTKALRARPTWGTIGRRCAPCVRCCCQVAHVGDALADTATVVGGAAGIIVDLFADGQLIPQLTQVRSKWQQSLSCSVHPEQQCQFCVTGVSGLPCLAASAGLLCRTLDTCSGYSGLGRHTLYTGTPCQTLPVGAALRR
jgi:hypothetical protein